MNFNKLYFCTKFKEWTNKVIPNKFRSLKRDTPRLVIPFFDEKNNIIGYQGRSFDPKDQCKYITIKLEGVENLIFGQERLNINKKQYCVEGPLDSLFLPNCLAIAGLNFKGVGLSSIIVLDNEKRNKQIKEALNKLIINGYSVCIWPDSVEEKDINDMIMNGKTTNDIVKKKSAILLDVWKKDIKPEKLDHKKWMPAQRYSISGAKWIPNAGLETLTPELRKYFEETVKRITKGNKNAKLVCFCRRGYYSKIAADRLVQMGYTNIFLYPGTDLWEDAGNRLVIVKPEVMRPKK